MLQQSNFLQTNGSSNASNRVSLEAIESAGDVELQQALRASVEARVDLFVGCIFARMFLHTDILAFGSSSPISYRVIVRMTLI